MVLCPGPWTKSRGFTAEVSKGLWSGNKTESPVEKTEKTDNSEIVKLTELSTHTGLQSRNTQVGVNLLAMSSSNLSISRLLASCKFLRATATHSGACRATQEGVVAERPKTKARLLIDCLPHTLGPPFGHTKGGDE